MTQEAIIAIGQQATLMMILLGGPVLIVSLIVGLLVSIFQAVTQVNETTLTFVPKIIAILVTVILMGPWMLEVFGGYTAATFASIASLPR